MDKNKTIYICPHCNKEQDSIIECHSSYIDYKTNLKTEESEWHAEMQGDRIAIECPGCRGDLPRNLVDTLNCTPMEEDYVDI